MHTTDTTSINLRDLRVTMTNLNMIKKQVEQRRNR